RRGCAAPRSGSGTGTSGLHVRVGNRHRQGLVGRVGAGLLGRRPRPRHRLGRGLQVLRELGPRPDRGALPGLRRVLDQLVHAPVRHPPTPPRACGGGHCARSRRAAPMVDKRTIKKSCSCAVPLVTMGAHEGRAMQVPAPFEYLRATSVEHAIGLRVGRGPETRLVAGGHSLLPMMKLRLAAPELLVDINELTDLAYVTVDRDVLRIGALTRHAALLAAPAVGDVAPVLHDAERSIADAIVRNRGTVGGSVCQADPSEDLSGAFCTLRADAVIRGEQGVRTVPMREFFLGPYQTAVGPAEMLVELRVPLWTTGSAYVKVDRRAGDWAIAAAAAALRVADGVIANAGIGLTAVGSFVAAEAEARLLGRPPPEES